MGFALTLTPILTGATASPSARWSACSYFDKVIFATASVNPKYIQTGGTLTDLPGLVPGAAYSGVASFQSHVILWQGSILQWSDLADFTNWIPVGSTASSMRLTLNSFYNGFVQPASGGTSGLFFVNESPDGLVEGQFMRLDLAPNYNFYSVVSVGPFNGITGANGVAGIPTERFTQTILPNTTTCLYMQPFENLGQEWAKQGYIKIAGINQPFQIMDVSRTDLSPGVGSGTGSVPAMPAAGALSAPVPVGFLTPVQWNIGDKIAIGAQSQVVGTYGFDPQIIVRAVQLQNNASIVLMQRENGGTFPTRVGITTGDPYRLQPWILINNPTSTTYTVPGLSLVNEIYSLVLQDLGKTGRSATSTVFSPGLQLQTLDANEAGDTINAGDRINGPILNFAQIGDLGYLLKSRSIQSVQYVGQSQGTFFIRPEVTDEGLIGNYAFITIGGGSSQLGYALYGESMIFLGHRELYKYVGGSVLTPICQGYTKQLFKELDRSLLNTIFMFHREQDNEVHVVYPVAGNSGSPQRVLIYNYIEDSCVIDDYDQTLGGITAGIGVNWNEPIRYIDETASYQGTSGSYLQLSSAGTPERVNLMAFGAAQPVTSIGEVGILPRLVVQGRVFDRKGQAYTCSAEVPDEDFGNAKVIKYGGYLQLYLEIKALYNDDLRETPGRPLRLFIQFAGRDNLDSDLRYTDPMPIEVSGNGNQTTKVTLRCSGRYLRFKLFSNQADIQWRLSGYNMTARLGNFY